jgi:hypothetical protein
MSDNKYGGIKPSDIPLVSDNHFILPLSGRFGKWEMDTVAYLIVMLLLEENLWRPVSLTEILKVTEKFSQRHPRTIFRRD